MFAGRHGGAPPGLIYLQGGVWDPRWPDHGQATSGLWRCAVPMTVATVPLQ